MYTLDENYIFVFEYKLRSHCHCSCRKFKLPPWLDLIQPIIGLVGEQAVLDNLGLDTYARLHFNRINSSVKIPN